MPYVKVAIDVPVATLFDYCAPHVTAADIGCRVRVPFGRKRLLGVIMEVGATPSLDPAKVRPAGDVLRDAPPLPLALLELLSFCSAYYHHPIGEVVHASLPGWLRIERKAPASSRPVTLTSDGDVALDQALHRAPAMRSLLTRVRTFGLLSEQRIRELRPAERRLLRQAIGHGWLTPLDAGTVQAPSTVLPSADCTSSATAEKPDRRLNAEQQRAMQAIVADASTFHCWLLHGVTGSGKTEVYLEVMHRVLDNGKQVLFLVPEIGLTPQLEQRIRARFPKHALVTMHSNMASGQRASHWAQAHSGAARIVVGARSAIFAPMGNLGLIVVDEEHDSSFKQMDGIRYSARDLAVWRARQLNVPVILGSATPSLESYQAALAGRYRKLALPQRATSIPLPDVRMIGVNREGSRGGLGPSVIDAIRQRIERSEQVLVFINRRGYAPVLICGDCGWCSPCHRCSARLVLHKNRQRMACHHCGHEEIVPVACGECGNADLHPLGYGTQRVEATLRTALPAARIMRVDRDTTRGRNTWAEMRASITRHDVDILVGTQLLSKGHDFPNLSLVCVLNADQSLYSTDFRAAEPLFAQLTQVAGRAGRAQGRGAVLIQSEFPMHPLYRAVQAHDYDGFAQALLEERRQTDLPPFSHHAVLRAEALQMEHALAFLHQCVHATKGITGDVIVFDPIAAPMQRLKGRERAQLLVQSKSRPLLHAFLDQWLKKLTDVRANRVRWSLDVDPLAI